MTAQEEWRRGWGLVVAGLCGLVVTASPIYTIGIFMAPLQEEFAWSRAQIAFAVSIVTLLGGTLGIAVGFAVDRVGARPIGLAGIVASCAAFGAFSNVGAAIESYWFYWIILSLAISMCSLVVWTKAIVAHFEKSRGLAISVTLCGATVAGVIAPILATYMIIEYGWRTAYIGFSAAMFVVCFPVIFIFSSKDGVKKAASSHTSSTGAVPGVTPPGMTVGQAVRTADFWLLAIPFCLFGGAVLCVPVHFVPMLQDRGLTAYYAATALSTVSVTAAIGRISVGYLLDKFSGSLIAASSFSFALLGCIVLLAVPATTASSYLAAAFFGVAVGAGPSLVPFITAKTFGLKAYGAIYSLMKASYTLGGASLPPIFGQMYELNGSYQAALMLLGAVCLAGMMIIQFSGRQPQAAAGSAS